jgi:SAM-dependent methyltransferase
MQALYNEICSSYCTTRRADPSITQTLAHLLSVAHGGNFLDLACGTGNYTNALASIGGNWHGCDISEVMVRQARAKNQEVRWQVSSADSLPYPATFFDGAICTLAIHHFPDLLQPFKEVYRTMRQGPFVLFTAFPEQMQRYWLCHYFPEMMASSIAQMPTQEIVTSALRSAGFEIDSILPFDVTNDLQDLFLYSGKERPELYLDTQIRANISSFASRCSQAELESGLKTLSDDIETCTFAELAASYRCSSGDYTYIVAHKRTT